MTAVPYDYWVGVDLGQRHDYTTVAVLEEPCWIPSGSLHDPQGWVPEGAPGGARVRGERGGFRAGSPRARGGGGRGGRGGGRSLDVLRGKQREHWRVLGENQGRPADPPLYLRHLARVRDLAYPAVVSRLQGL